ncbi:AraC family transcriptional regulator [Pigmentiphaga aceris]|uniref:AraC family transcriptional regulator n=1 Tax=Pigmentiphaga aceris TaxID=1940612 RepID=A0A5C0AV28_9BURK|nr:AraC family transcriptional regulator [Pigmentiphaga aceris]QEI06279.1 AraC family transcriptional regulator [Pigmentiphaga aceris]
MCVAPVFVRPVLDAAQRDGHDCARLCRGLGFECKDLENPGFVLSHAEANTVIRRGIEALRRPFLGLELGMRCNIVNRGALALGLMASPTLGDAIKLKLKFPASAGLLLHTCGEYEAAGYVETAASLHGNHANVPFLTEKMFTSMVKIRRVLLGRHYAPSLVEFMHACPGGNLRVYEDFFGCTVRFDAMQNQLISPAHWMDVPLATSSPTSYQFACQLMQKECEQASATSTITLAVERLINKGLPHPPEPAQLARLLNISERTLRRKLAESGMTYQAMVNDGRKSRAIELVLSSRLGLRELATEAGFADVRSFRRAFTRWTGRSVSAARSEAATTDLD